MYICGVLNKPATFQNYDTADNFSRRMKRLTELYPNEMLFSTYIPGHDQINLCMVKAKLDTMCFYTTREEASAQYDRYLKFYSPRELFQMQFLTGEKFSD